MRDFYNIVAPFIAAFLASGLTYFFALRTKKHEVLISERLPAFKAIQKKLIAIQHYCEAHIAEFNGIDLAARPNDLPPEENKSALEHLIELKHLLDGSLVFFSESSKSAADVVCSQLAFLCSVELACQRIDGVFIADGAYKAALEPIAASVQKLYHELKLPK